jgi:hypothetical protein
MGGNKSLDTFAVQALPATLCRDLCGWKSKCGAVSVCRFPESQNVLRQIRKSAVSSTAGPGQTTLQKIWIKGLM